MLQVKQVFDKACHDRLLATLAASDYVERYLELCDAFEADRDLDGPRLDLVATSNMFRELGVQVHLDKRFKVMTFDQQRIAGWLWQGKLVVQRYDTLEPMFEGETPRQAVGSTMLDLALDAADLRTPPVPRERFLPPHPNRPRFNGNMQTMKRLVTDLVALQRWMRELIGATWTDHTTVESANS